MMVVIRTFNVVVEVEEGRIMLHNNTSLRTEETAEKIKAAILNALKRVGPGQQPFVSVSADYVDFTIQYEEDLAPEFIIQEAAPAVVVAACSWHPDADLSILTHEILRQKIGADPEVIAKAFEMLSTVIAEDMK